MNGTNFVRERFVRVNGETYFESELRLMNETQLKDLIIKCQNGIDEINKKKSDYVVVNQGLEEDDHYRTVISKFNSAAVYLQSDIVLLENIIKDKKLDDNPAGTSTWLEHFYGVVKKNLPLWKFEKLKKLTDTETGFELED